MGSFQGQQRHADTSRLGFTTHMGWFIPNLDVLSTCLGGTCWDRLFLAQLALKITWFKLFLKGCLNLNLKIARSHLISWTLHCNCYVSTCGNHRRPQFFPICMHLSDRFFPDTLVPWTFCAAWSGARMGYFTKRLYDKNVCRGPDKDSGEEEEN